MNCIKLTVWIVANILEILISHLAKSPFKQVHKHYDCFKNIVFVYVLTSQLYYWVPRTQKGCELFLIMSYFIWIVSEMKTCLVFHYLRMKSYCGTLCWQGIELIWTTCIITLKLQFLYSVLIFTKNLIIFNN